MDFLSKENMVLWIFFLKRICAAVCCLRVTIYTIFFASVSCRNRKKPRESERDCRGFEKDPDFEKKPGVSYEMFSGRETDCLNESIKASRHQGHADKPIVKKSESFQL